jgi:hypothetical protein
MEISTRELWTMIHGMGFGALYLMACSGALVTICRRPRADVPSTTADNDGRFLQIYLSVMAALAWITVLTGTYLVYPWYRALPPKGTTNLAAYPQHLLLSSPITASWHLIGMEWKEHIAFVVPIAITMCAAVSIEYGRNLNRHPALRNAILAIVATSLVAAGVAGFFGAMLAKTAPIEGGATIHLSSETTP